MCQHVIHWTNIKKVLQCRGWEQDAVLPLWALCFGHLFLNLGYPSPGIGGAPCTRENTSSWNHISPNDLGKQHYFDIKTSIGSSWHRIQFFAHLKDKTDVQKDHPASPEPVDRQGIHLERSQEGYSSGNLSATLQAEQVGGKNTVPSQKGSHTRCFKEKLASKRTFKCECILIGEGPEGEEGQEGPFWERKEHKEREGHGKERGNSLVWAGSRAPGKWWQRKQERGLGYSWWAWKGSCRIRGVPGMDEPRPWGIGHWLQNAGCAGRRQIPAWPLWSCGKSSNHWMPIFPSRKWGRSRTHSLRTLGRLNEIRKIRHLV